MEEIIWSPTDEEKRKIEDVCNRCIDILYELEPIEQKVFALQTLVDSFKDVSGVTAVGMIVTKDVKGENDDD